MANKDDLNLNQNGGAKPAGGKAKWIVLALVLLVGAGGAAWFFLAGPGAQNDATEEPEPEPEPEKEPIYLPMERFTVNFDDGGRIRYVQADMQLMAFDQALIDRASRNMPAIRNRLILLLSDQDFAALRSVEGKEALRETVRAAVNETLETPAQDGIQAVFFTSFVLQ
jgi:flagellar FliL protein